MTQDNSVQRKSIRRTALIMVCVAIVFYVGFILMGVSRAYV